MSTQISSSNPDGPDFGDELFQSAELAPVTDAPRPRSWRRAWLALLLLAMVGGAAVGVQRYDHDEVQPFLNTIHAAIRPADREPAPAAPAPALAAPVVEVAKPSREMLAEWTKAMQDVKKQGHDALAQQQAVFLAETKRLRDDFLQATLRLESKFAASATQSVTDHGAVKRLEAQLDEVKMQLARAGKDTARFDSEMQAKQKELDRFQKQLTDTQAKLAETQELAGRTQEDLVQERSRKSQLQKEVAALAQAPKPRVEEAPRSPAFFGVEPRVVDAAPSVKQAPQRMNWTGRIAENSPKDRKHGAPSAVHTTTLRQGVRYVIDLTSSAFDPMLRLEDSQGREIMEDDDGGDGLNSRIHYTPTQTGVFRLVVTRYSGAGDYQLSVREP